jgi:hypothetical protein
MLHDIDATLAMIRGYIEANRRRGQTTNLIIRDNGKAARVGVRVIERVSGGQTEILAEKIEWR